ncbi:MAG: glycosyltransferase [Alphaproteobacteria bacterium]|nr:glycosyltransferase [Alphaproteobacteria bacterium]
MEPRPLPQFSIVMPIYNLAHLVADAIGSVVAQTHGDWEIVVVDDGSTDGLDASLEAFDDRRLRVMSVPHGGLDAARRTGTEAAQGTYLVYLDADDRLLPSALERFAAAFERDPAIGVAYGDRVFIAEDGRSLGTPPRLGLRRPFDGRVFSRVVAGCPFAAASQAAIRLSALRDVGGYPVGLGSSSDWYMWCRLAAEVPFAYIGAGAVTQYRLRADSPARSWTSEPVERPNIEQFRQVIDAIHGMPEITSRFHPLRRRLLRRRSAAHAYFIKAHEYLRVRRFAAARQYFGAGLRAWPLEPAALLGFVMAATKFMPRAAWCYVGYLDSEPG